MAFYLQLMKGKKKAKQKDEKNFLNKKTKRNKNINIIDYSGNQILSKNSISKNNEVLGTNLLNVCTNKNSEKNVNQITKFKTNPTDIKYSNTFIDDIDHYSSFSENVFLIFKSVDDIYYLVYENTSKKIISYHLFEEKIITEIKYNNDISCFNHYPDYYNKRDVIMTIEAEKNNIKVYNFQDWTLIHEFNKINKNGYLNIACFYCEANNIFVVTSNSRYSAKNVEPIKIYDLKGNKIKDLKDSNENVSFLDTYYDKKTNINYILAGFTRYIKAYNYTNNAIYHIYKDKYNPFHRNIVVNDNPEITKLIESSSDGYIRIWDFHKGEFIKRIYVEEEDNKGCEKGAYGICLWNDEYLFVGINKKIVLVNINTYNVIMKFEYKIKNTCIVHYNDIIAIKKINHPKFGECLLSKAKDENKIQLWKRKK